MHVYMHTCMWVCIYISTYVYKHIATNMHTVFVYGRWEQGSNTARVISKTQKWYLISTCLTLSIISYGPTVRWTLYGVAPSHTPRCSSYWKGSLLVAPDYPCQLYFFYTLYIYVYICACACVYECVHFRYLIIYTSLFYIYIYIYMLVCLAHVFTEVRRINVYMPIYTHTHHTYIYIYICVCVSVCVCVCVCVLGMWFICLFSFISNSAYFQHERFYVQISVAVCTIFSLIFAWKIGRPTFYQMIRCNLV